MHENEIHDAICGKSDTDKGKTCEDPTGHTTRLKQYAPGLFDE